MIILYIYIYNRFLIYSYISILHILDSYIDHVSANLLPFCKTWNCVYIFYIIYILYIISYLLHCTALYKNSTITTINHIFLNIIVRISHKISYQSDTKINAFGHASIFRPGCSLEYH